MTIVLLHGVPENADIWDDVRERLNGDSVALRLPGFGSPRPDGFGATKDDYVGWIVDELRRFDEPVDLVGHDWGGGFSIRIGQKYPELVRSWTTDIAGCFHPDYVWHDFAKLWQTPGDGEAFFDQQNAQSPEERAPVLQMFGLGEKEALKLAGMTDPIMGTCIPPLYRSAAPNPYAGWPDCYAKATRPALVIMPSDDPFTAGHLAAEVAGTFGAKVAPLQSNHFWPLEQPDAGARIINEFVSSL